MCLFAYSHCLLFTTHYRVAREPVFHVASMLACLRIISSFNWSLSAFSFQIPHSKYLSTRSCWQRNLNQGNLFRDVYIHFLYEPVSGRREISGGDFDRSILVANLYNCKTDVEREEPNCLMKWNMELVSLYILYQCTRRMLPAVCPVVVQLQQSWW